MTREWFAIAELAGLPGLPSSRFGIAKVAERCGWMSREREGRGGGREYHVSALPPKTRVALGMRALRDEAPPSPVQESPAERTVRAESLVAFTRLANDKRARAEARFAVLQALTAFEVVAQQGGRVGTELFVRAYNAGSISVDAGVRELVPTLTPRTLYRWRAQERELGLVGLADDYGNRAGCGKIESEPELREAVLGLILQTPHIQPRHVHEYLTHTYGERASGIGESAVARFITRWKTSNGQLYLNLTNPDAWKNKHMAAFGSLSAAVTELNQLWEFDGTPADVMLADGRHHILGVIDVYSRRLKLLVSKTSKSTMVATLMRRAILDWGVPAAAKTDNGKDYVSRYFTAVLRDLDVCHVLCPPFRGDLKPHIERAFRTFSHDLIPLMPEFTGHNIAERVALRARESFAQRILQSGATADLPITASELQAFCDDWSEKRYQHRPHDGLRGRTPFQVAAAWTAPVRRVADERALDMLLAEPAQGSGRKVLKKGIGVEGTWFVAPELGEIVGERVDVRLDPDELGRIFVYRIDHVTGAKSFVCEATAAERLGVGRAEVARQTKRLQAEAIREQRAALREAKRNHKQKGIWAALAERDSAEAAKLAQLPRPVTEHTTSALEAAADAVAARDAATAEPLPPVRHAPSEALERGGKLLDLVASGKREQRERELEDRRACERYATLLARGEDTWAPNEAAWMAAMRHDSVIQAWLEVERAKQRLSERRDQQK